MNQPREDKFLIRDAVANVLRIASLVAIALGLFAIAVGGLAVYLNLTAQLDLERAENAATQQASRITEQLSTIQTSLRDASVVDAARAAGTDGSAGNPALRQALRERGAANILDARILPARVDAIATSDDIDLDFATTEIVFDAIENESAAIRVLYAGQPDESLAFARRLPDGSGVVLLRVTVSVVTSLLQDPQQLDFLALAQDSGRNVTILHAVGRSTAAQIRKLPLEGSRLVLQYSRGVVSGPMETRSAVIFGSSGVILLMLGLLVRRRSRLARYLGHESAAGAARPSGANPPAGGTVALDPNETNEYRAGGDDEAETVQVDRPDLPQWLREDVDDGREKKPPRSGR